MSVPPDLKFISPFVQRSIELGDREPIISYYCDFYAAKLAIALKTKSKEATAFLLQLLDKLESKKKQLAGNDAITNDTVGYAHIENFALKVFLNADNEDRAGAASKKTARTFLAAAVFMELLKTFGDLDPQVEEKIKYSKWKAADILKAVKEGRQPLAGPPVPDSDDVSVSPTPSPGIPNISSVTSVTSQPLQTQSPHTQALVIDPRVNEQIQKHCRYTISALQYDDVSTAIDNLEKALALLHPYKNK